jgi:hypothetical protein
VAAGYAFAFADGQLERAKNSRRLPLQRYTDVNRHALAEQPVVDLSAVAADSS